MAVQSTSTPPSLKDLVAQADEANVTEDFFSDTVIDLSVDVALDEINATEDRDEQEDLIIEAEMAGEDVNNSGVAAQIEFMLAHLHYHVEVAAAHIEARIREHAQS